tara:strand:- start:352 stop:480 length:129 start_codon:yes stop_codon:yes gene_type:complete
MDAFRGNLAFASDSAFTGIWWDVSGWNSGQDLRAAYPMEGRD